jgi:hypothetical protein
LIAQPPVKSFWGLHQRFVQSLVFDCWGPGAGRSLTP